MDEATDVCGQSVCGALIGTFNEVEKPALFDFVELSETNNKTISQLVISVIARTNGPEDFTKPKLVVTDGAAYMIKHGNFPKEMFEDLLHFLCVAHMLHRFADFVRSEKLVADEFCSLMKHLLLKRNTRKSIYNETTVLPLPPVPVITRWGTWITSNNY